MKKMLHSRKLSTVVPLLIISLSATVALAQGRAAIEEIVVTANKRSATDAQDVGISLSAISGETLAREGLDNFSEFATTVAGLSFGERGPGQSLIIIRGVNSSTTQFNTDEPESKETVAVYFDETPVSLNGFNPNPRLFDMERIEILRGPQGTLFGSGSLAGTIRYISKAPDPEAFALNGGVSYSNTSGGGNNIEVNNMINLPIGNSSALRVSTYVRSIDGFIDNVAIDDDPRHPLTGQGDLFNEGRFDNVNTDGTWGARIQYLYQPSDKFKAIARVYHQESDFGGYPTEDTYAEDEPLKGNNPANALLGDFEQSRLTDEISSDSFTLYNFDTHSDLRFGNLVTVLSFLQHNLVQDFEFSDIIPALLGIADPQTFPAPALLNNETKVDDFIFEARLSSKDESNFNWLVGVFYNSQDKTFLQSGPVPNLTSALATFNLPILSTVFAAAAPGNPDNIFESRSEFDESQISIFGEASWDINDYWRLIVGLRWFSFDQDFFFGDTQGAFSSGRSIDNNLSEDGVNPKFSVEYKAGKDTLVYATVAQGFRLGGNNDPLPNFCGVTTTDDDFTFESDSLWNYEIGLKATLNNRLQINTAVYQIDWSDIPVSEAFACGFALTTNAASADIFGIETDITYAVTSNFQLSGNFSYIKSEFSDDFAPLSIVDGTKTPLVPEFTFNANAIYYFPLGSKEGFVSATYSFQDERFNTANPTERVAMASYSIVNLRFGIETERWRTALYFENLFDERAVILKDTIFLQENRDTVNRPFTVGISLSAHF